jgi:tetratricopeptide (TPR) repeat protein
VQTFIRSIFIWSLVVLGLLSYRSSAFAAALVEKPLEEAHADLEAGRADGAIAHLGSALTANPHDAEAHNLLCRVYYQEARWDDAIHECETAVSLAPNNSEDHLWLGRAYGEKANSIHSIRAYGLAKKVHDEFERAVQLDRANVSALADLGEFYTAAPGIVGGGKEKAQGLAQTMQSFAPEQADQLLGRLAEKDKNYPQAESEYKSAVEVSHNSAGAWMELASYYARRHQPDQMLDALHAGLEADAHSNKPRGPALVDAAQLLTRTHQDPQLATQLLEQYLTSPNRSADSPAFQVHIQLARLLDQLGDHDGARQHTNAAAALAHEYHPPTPKS